MSAGVLTGSPLAAAAEWRAIGCEVRLVVTDPARLDAAREILAAHVDELDRAASRFRDDSELSAVNARSGAPVPVGTVLMDALQVALDAAASSGGWVDPTLGRALSDVGYDRTFRTLPADGPGVVVRTARRSRWTQVRVDRAEGTVQVPAGVALDLGATAKAWAADRAAASIIDELRAAGPLGVLVSLGGDIAVAGEPPAGGWAVRVQDRPGPLDERPAGPTSTVAVTTGGLATSSTTARRWRRGGDWMHHLIDPTTGLPAVSPWRTATVAADSCVAANVASTAAIVRGVGALDALREGGLPARLVAGDGTVTCVNGWPMDQDVPAAGPGSGPGTDTTGWSDR